LSTPIPVTFRASPLVSNFQGTPQQFLDAIVARLSIESPSNSVAIITYGSVLPTSDVGPFLLNGITWYVWDVGTGSYVPQVVTAESLRYIASASAPDQAKYIFWIELNGSGKAISIKYYSGGAWKDIYEDKFATFATTSSVDAQIAAALKFYPASAQMTVDQNFAVNTLLQKINFNDDFINPDGVYSSADARYNVPVSGIYRVNANLQIDNTSADVTSLEFSLRIALNGNPFATNYPISGYSVASPPGDRFYPQVAGLIQASSGDILEVYLSAQDGTNTGFVSIAQSSQFFIELVQAS